MRKGALDTHLPAKTRCECMPEDEQVEVIASGENQQHFFAAAWDIPTAILHPLSVKKSNTRDLDVLGRVDFAHPVGKFHQALCGRSYFSPWRSRGTKKDSLFTTTSSEEGIRPGSN